MKREIKFRAWDTRGKYMESCQLLTFDNHCPIEEHFADDGLVFMQYTGIKDRAGKEIFEGDILENKVYGGIWQVCWARKDWDYAGFVLRHVTNNTDNLILFSDKENLEVIGNIYQNPELLQCPKT